MECLVPSAWCLVPGAAVSLPAPGTRHQALFWRDTVGTVRRAIQITSIALLTLFFLGLFLWKSNLRDVAHIIESTNVPWFAIGLLINFTTLIFRTFRWRAIIGGEERPAFYPTFFANTVGYMLSTILPIRAGDVARPALLSRRSRVRFASALGTVVTERILDLIAILLLFFAFAFLRWEQFRNSDWFFVIETGTIACAIAIAANLILILGLYFFRTTVRRFHAWLGRLLPNRFHDAWMHFFDSFVATLDLGKRPSDFFVVIVCTIGIWGCLTAQLSAVLYAVHRPLPYDASFFINGISTLGMAIPTPGGVGGFHKACQIVLTRFYRFDIDSSVAVAILFHIVGTAPVILTGLSLLVKEGLTWRGLRAQTHADGVNS